MDVALAGRARTSTTILDGWHDGWVEAERQGRAGELEPNEVVQPENEVQQPVPDITVRHYFIRADDPAKAREMQALVRRLQRMDVRVRRLTRPLPVGDYTPYGRAGALRGAAGRHLRRRRWTSAKKHWVQAMLNEDTYVPFPYFYDVTAWSEPLLFNVDGGYSGGGSPTCAPPRCARRPIRACRPRPRTRRGSRCTRCRRSSRAGSSPPAGCATCSTAGGSSTPT